MHPYDIAFYEPRGAGYVPAYSPYYAASTLSMTPYPNLAPTEVREAGKSKKKKTMKKKHKRGGSDMSPIREAGKSKKKKTIKKKTLKKKYKRGGSDMSPIREAGKSKKKKTMKKKYKRGGLDMSPIREAGKSKKKKTMKKKHKCGGLDMSPIREAGAKRKSKTHKYNVLFQSKSGLRKVWTGSAKSPLAAAKKYVKAWRAHTHKKSGKKGSMRKIKFPHKRLFAAQVGKHKYSTYLIPSTGLFRIFREKICKSNKKDLVARLTGKMPKACRTSKQKKKARAPFRKATLKKYAHLLRK